MDENEGKLKMGEVRFGSALFEGETYVLAMGKMDGTMAIGIGANQREALESMFMFGMAKTTGEGAKKVQYEMGAAMMQMPDER